MKSTKTPSPYKFTYVDKRNNELDSTILWCNDKSEAVQIAKRLFADCMCNDTVKVKSQRAY